MQNLSFRTRVLNALRSPLRLRPLGLATVWFVRGCSAGGLLSRIPPNCYQYPKGSTRRLTRNGVTVQLDLSDFVDSEPGVFEMTVMDPGNVDMNRIAGKAIAGAHGVGVEIETLDRIIAGRHLKTVDLIKIDVEGFERNVLEGAKETIRRFRPTLVIELDDKYLGYQGSSSEEVLRWLDNQGYDARLIGTVDAVDHRMDLRGRHVDIVARPRKGIAIDA